MQHRHEDRHAVYVAGCNNGINAQHRHEDRHGVYVLNENTLKKWVDVIHTTTANESDTENIKEKGGDLISKAIVEGISVGLNEGLKLVVITFRIFY